MNHVRPVFNDRPPKSRQWWVGKTDQYGEWVLLTDGAWATPRGIRSGSLSHKPRCFKTRLDAARHIELYLNR